MQDLLEKEKANLSDIVKEKASLDENLKIAQERTEHAIKEKEKF